jgi:hypothetical protein
MTVIYSICDALGILVWDEARDFWRGKVSQFRSMVKHHRSHPSVAVWGLCNEQECYPEQNASPAGANATVESFKRVVTDLDPARPITMNDNGLQDGTALDIAGWSHSGESGFALLHKLKPKMPQLLSECCSCPSTRGYLPGLACMRGQNSPGL